MDKCCCDSQYNEGSFNNSNKKIQSLKEEIAFLKGRLFEHPTIQKQSTIEAKIISVEQQGDKQCL